MGLIASYINLIVLTKSISGYIGMISRDIFIFCFFLKMSHKKQKFVHILISFVFCYYLIGLLTMTGIGRGLTLFSPHFGLISFVDTLSDPVETVLNIILFTPLGSFCHYCMKA